MRGDSPDDSASSGGNGPGYGAPGLGSTADPSLRQAQGPPPFMPEPEPAGLTLRDYISVLWRRKWTILLVVVAATASAYYFSSLQVNQYSASASLIYQQQIDLANPLNGGYTDVAGLDRQLAAISDLMASPDMQLRIENLIKQENVNPSAGYGVTAKSASGSDIVVMSAYSTDAELAAAAANASATAFVDMKLEQQRGQIAAASAVIEGQLAKYMGAAKRSADYLMLEQRLQDLQILYGTATGSYRVFARASVPGAPYAPNPLRNASLAFGVSLVAGIVLAFLLEQFDTRLRRPDEAARILHQPVLGRIPRMSKKLLDDNAIVALTHPDGQAADAFRLVRTNLDFMRVGSEFTSLLVTSCAQGEGKSLAVANLAVTMAMAGKRVVVVDADLRRPRQHTFFGVANESGVSTVAAGKTELVDSLVPVEVKPSPSSEADEVGFSTSLSDYATWARGTSARSRMYLLPSGPIPPNPGEIVASHRFGTIMDTLVTQADIVIVDSPAMLAVGDAAALASSVDGLVFVVDMHIVRRPMLVQAADQLVRLPCRSLGILMRTQGAKSGGYSSSYRYYGAGEDGGKPRSRSGKGAATGAVDLKRLPTATRLSPNPATDRRRIR
jgi:succinoglycan biosynthesis transport protein ExoP